MLKNSKVVLFLLPYKVGQAGNFWTLLRKILLLSRFLFFYFLLLFIRPVECIIFKTHIMNVVYFILSLGFFLKVYPSEDVALELTESLCQIFGFRTVLCLILTSGRAARLGTVPYRRRCTVSDPTPIQGRFTVFKE